MPTRQHINIRAARKEITRLLEEETGLCEDLRLLRDGNRLAYAIDYNDIFSYVSLWESTEQLVYAYLDRKIDIITRIAFNESVSDEILFGDRFNIIILPPHRLELLNLARSLKYREVTELAYVWERAEKRARAATNEMSEAASRLRVIAKCDRPDPAELLSILEMIETDASELLIMARRKEVSPIERMRNFRKLSHLKNTEDFLPNTCDNFLVDDLFDEALRLFKRRRPNTNEGSNRIDAYALSYLSWLNTVSDEKTFFRLIARSRVFHEVFQELRESEKFGGRLGNWLRAPRSFGILRFCRFAKEDEIVTLQKRIETHSLMREIVRAMRDDIRDSEKEMRHGALLQERLSQLDGVFSKIANLAILGGLAQTKGTAESDFRFADKFFNLDFLSDLLGDIDVLRTVFHDRAESIFKEMSENTFEALEDVIELHVTENDQDSLKIARVQEEDSNLERIRVTLSEEDASFPYALDFYSPELRGYKRGGRSGWSSLRKLARSGSSAGHFEALLAFAVMLAARGEWGLSFSLSEMAIGRVTQDDRAFSHEAFYFRALARRYALPHTSSNLRNSLDDLVTAISLRHSLYPDSDSKRYLNEFAIVVRELEDRKAHFDKTILPVQEDSISIWRSLVRRASDKNEEIRYQNNIVFSFTQRGDVEAVRRELISLRSMFEDADSHQLSLRRNIQHTLLKAAVMVEDLSVEQRENMLNEIAELEASTFTPSFDEWRDA